MKRSMSEPAASIVDRGYELERLKRECDDLERKLLIKRRLMSNLAVAYTLPDDVWYHILELAYHHFPECHTTNYAERAFPIPISHVSRRFLALAVSLPTLWTCIHITPRFGRDNYTTGLLELQLSRSRDRPLTILFSCFSTDTSAHSSFWTDWDEFSGSEEFEHYDECWQRLLAEAHRWRRLSFYARLQGLACEFLTKSVLDEGLSLPLLEHLDVYVAAESGSNVPGVVDEDLGPWSVDQLDAPLLRYFRGHGLFLFSLRPTKTNLRELVLQSVHEAMQYCALVEVIGATSATLTTLVVYDVRFLEIPHPPSHTFATMPRLRHLLLGKLSALRVLLADLLDSAPELLRLDIASGEDIGSAVRYLDTGSYPSVQILGFQSDETTAWLDEFGAYEIGPFLELFTGLRHLIVGNCNCGPYISTLLTRSHKAVESGNALLWPALTKVTLTTEEAWENTEYDYCCELETLVGHRADIGLAFRTIVIQTWAFREDVLQALRQKVHVTQIGEEQIGLHRYFSMEKWSKLPGSSEDVPTLPLWTEPSFLELDDAYTPS